jgi:hypothetical protein
MGPDGWMLCIQDLDMMEDVSTIRAKEVYPKWPGAQNAMQSVNLSSTLIVTFHLLTITCILPASH